MTTTPKPALGVSMTGSTGFDEKLIARIQKMHRQAESAKKVGSVAEADAFMAAVQKTLNKYNLDASVLSLDLRDREDPMGADAEWGVTGRHRNRPVLWAQHLAVAVATAHHCSVLVSNQSSTVFFYGRASNRGVCLRMFRYLRDIAEASSWTAYVAEVGRRKKLTGSEKGAGQWRLNWLEGFVATVNGRYHKLRQDAESDTGMALVLTSVKAEADAYAEQQISKGKPKRQKNLAASKMHSLQAQLAGMAAAQDVSLTPHHLRDGASDVPAPKQLRR